MVKKKCKWQLHSVCVLLFGMILFSCNKHDLSKIAGIKWDPNLATPIGYADFGIHDLFSSFDSSFVIDPSGQMTLVYEDNLDTILAQSIVQLDDFSDVIDVTPPALGGVSTGSFNGTISSTTTENSDYVTQNGVELHTLNFESGSLALTLSTTLQHDVTLVITLLDLQSNSTPIQRTLDVSYTGSLPQTATSVVDLSDVLADFTAGGGNVNRLRVSVDATITGTGQPIVGNETLTLAMNLTNLEFKNITGYFGSDVLTAVSDSILMKIFNNPSAGNLAFTNPSLTFTIDNSFGIPVDINFSNFATVNTVTGQTTTLSGFPPVLSVNAPTSFGQTATTNMVFNTANTTNLSSIIDAVPKYFQYTISATSNPDGNVLPLNFIESTSKLIVKAKLELPMEGYASGISAKDTLDFSYDGDVESIESAMFRLYAKNGFPVSFDAQVSFTDENYNTLFTLFNTPQQLVAAASVNSSGVVSSSTSKTTDITIPNSKILLLGNVKHVIISGIAATTAPANTVVKFYDSYRIAVKLGMQVHMNVNL